MNRNLKEKILEMARLDQELREKAVSGSKDKDIGKKIHNIDKTNTREAKRIIKEYGWPTFDMVGKKASNAFWLIVQHADVELDFQKKSLALLKEAVKTNQANLKNLAFLTDRVFVNDGKKQLYGTQFFRKGDRFVPRPIRNKKEVDKRRVSVGLNLIKEREEEVNKEYHLMINKK